MLAVREAFLPTVTKAHRTNLLQYWPGRGPQARDFDQHDLEQKSSFETSSLKYPLGFAKNPFMLALGHKIGHEKQPRRMSQQLRQTGPAETVRGCAHTVSLDKVQLLPPRLSLQEACCRTANGVQWRPH
jgi:hypothetical protein